MAPREPSVTLQQAAAELNIEPWRMARLGRYLRIDSDEKCIPRQELDHAASEESADKRYLVVLHWLLVERHTRHENGQ